MLCLAELVITGCAHYRAKPLKAEASVVDFESRSFTDAGFHEFLEVNRDTGEWPRRTWDLESLTFAAFYFLLNRSDLLALLSEYVACEEDLRLELARQYPDVHFNPGYEYDQGDNKWGVGLSLELPFMNRNRGPIAEAEARRSECVAKFIALQAHILEGIERDLTAFQFTEKSFYHADSLAANLTKQERLLNGRF